MEQQSDIKPSTAGVYERWLAQTHRAAWSRRTAERNAAFLLPLLKPGIRLLDAGCGAGSITAGLAERVAPGECVGIDINGTSIDAARGLAAERGVANARFDQADIYELPFEDASFDVAFSHCVLQHLREPVAALRELHRVLRPGGIVAISDADFASGVVWPPSAGLEAAERLSRALREQAGGQWDVGRRLRALLHEADFAASGATAIVHSYASKEATAQYGDWNARYVEAPEYAAHVVALGLTTEDELREIASAWRAWGAEAGAFWSGIGVQIVGFR